MDKNRQILELIDVSIGYEGKALVQHINARANLAKFVLLLGANGKGKSTLLKTIANHLSSINGKIILDNQEVTSLSSKQMAQQLAFLQGNLTVPNEVTVADMLHYARIPYIKGLGRLSEADQQVINEVVDELKLHSLFAKPYMTLSDGQKQLVNIARSLVQQTPIIALDEPTAHLDIVNKRMVFQLLSDQVKKGKLVICCTHDLAEGMKYANEAWLITKRGEFEQYADVSSADMSSIESKLF